MPSLVDIFFAFVTVTFVAASADWEPMNIKIATIAKVFFILVLSVTFMSIRINLTALDLTCSLKKVI
jgi:hypothetical protein